MTTLQIRLLLFIVTAIALFFLLGFDDWLTFARIKAESARLALYRDAHPFSAALLYALVYVAVTGLSLPGAAALTLVGGALFGLFWGAVIVSFASSIGATLAFLAARFVFRDAVKAKLGSRMEAIDAGLSRDGAYYLFSLRLVPLFPFFVINLAMGLTAIKPLTFYWVSQVGMLAGTLVYVNAGKQLAGLDSLSGILSPPLVGAFVLLGLFPLAAKKLIEVMHKSCG